MPIFRRNDLRLIQPDWPMTKSVKAYTTTRIGDGSRPPFDGFNLAMHVGDDPRQVLASRQHLAEVLALPTEPYWLDQLHTDIVVKASNINVEDAIPQADASWTDEPNRVLAVMTADCLPLLVSDVSGKMVAAIHAGWKGLLNGIIPKTIAHLPVSNDQLRVWIGPAIGRQYFEVGTEVYEAFMAADQRYQPFLTQQPVNPLKWLVNLPGLAEFQLNQCHIATVFQSQLCSYHQADWFYSYRRDGQTGRMASLIWIEDKTD